MHFQSVTFDLDGTLLDTIADLAEACRLMLDDIGAPQRTPAEVHSFVGKGMAVLVERCLTHDKPPTADALHAAIESFKRHYTEVNGRFTQIYPGVLDGLQAWQASGLKMGVVTNKPHRFTTLCCDHFFPAGTFEVVFGQRDEVPRKPDPAAALEAAGILGLPVAECAYVGDSGIDMKFAQNAGMFGIGVSWGFRSVQELRENGAQAIVDHPRELLPFAGQA